MSRVKRGIATKKRHKRILKQTKGFWGQRKNIIRRASETLRRALAYAYVGRKLRKRDMRGLFITRINAACKQNGLNYSSFIAGLKKSQIELNRKMLSQIAVFEPDVFSLLVQRVKSA
jgi:large subunit ribosomal protein L20